MRYITSETLLYSEMVVDGTLLHNTHDLEVFIGHKEVEHPLCLQLGGCTPERVGEAAALCEAYNGHFQSQLKLWVPFKQGKTSGVWR